MLDLTNVTLESDLLPNGDYVVVVEDAEIKETKDGAGEYIKAKMKVIEGERKGKVLYQMFNIKNKNSEAVRIGHQQLKTFMKVSGMENFVLKSVNDLCGLKAVAIVKSKTDDYGEKNVISYFKEYKTSSPSQGAFAGSEIPF
jgi:hypothetical protein